ncbi:MAG: MFS transporter [Clostridia bacterium]
MNAFRAIKTYIISKIYPQSYLSPELIALLSVHGIFLLAVGLSNTFISVFLLKVEKDLSIVVLFNAIYYATIPIIFIFGGWLAKRLSLTFNLRIGILCYSALFIVLLIVQDRAPSYIGLLGVMMGISAGFYYLSYNVLGYDFSTNDNRDYVMSIQGLVFSIATMIATFTAGIIIESFKGLKGYIIIFSASLTLFIIAGVLSSKIPTKAIDKQYYIKSILFMPFKKKNWRYVMLGELLRGFRDGVMLFLMGILLYIIVNREAYIGSLTLISSAVQLISFYYISKKMNPYSRKKYMLIGAIFITLVSLVFLYEINIWTIFIYGIISSFYITFINNSTIGIIYWVIHKTPNSKKRRIEGIVVREVYLNVGRVAGVLLLLVFVQDLKSMALFILGLGASQILMWHLFCKVKLE